MRRSLGIEGFYDLVTPYPLFAARRFSSIPKDIAALQNSDAVSLMIRTDAFSEDEVIETRNSWDWFRPFKTHHITNLSKPWRETAGRNALRYEKRARENFDFSIAANPTAYVADMVRLNATILKRTRGEYTATMSDTVIESQLNLEGARLFKAENKFGVQGLALFMITGRKAYAYLLGATNEARAKNVIYGLYGFALDTLQSDIDVVDFGGAPGAADDAEHSVVQFKKLWTNQSAQSYICGKIFRPEIYHMLSETHPRKQPDFFPAYHLS